MTRPTDNPKKRGDFRDKVAPDKTRSITLPDEMDIEGEIRVRSNETPAERSHRLRMEVRRFWIEEAPVHLTAIGIAVSGTVLALVITFRPSSSVEDKKWAFSVLSHLLIAVADFAFGKAAK